MKPAGKPEDSGISLETVRQLGPHFPLFGVCMGHQCIGQAFGGKVVRAPCGVMHGKSSPVFHKDLGTLKASANPPPLLPGFLCSGLSPFFFGLR